MKNCNCKERYSTIIDSWDLFVEVKSFLEDELNKDVFEDITMVKPIDCGKDEKGEPVWHYTQRLFKCQRCGCLWALRYPDFPAFGFVGKYLDGKLNDYDWE